MTSKNEAARRLIEEWLPYQRDCLLMLSEKAAH